MLRVGVPLPGGQLVAAAQRYAALFSANAFRRRDNRGWVPARGLPADSALDSAGFVAMVRYGGYRWTADEYLDLASAWPWAWYASMDYCCEPEIAHNQPEITARLERTASSFLELRAAARNRGVSDPMPVLQGRTADDYLRCAELTGDLPRLVGLGSICRREVRGVLSIVDRLDARLPRHVGLHLFGVKGDALSRLQGHPRVTSSDSMAWDFEARRTKVGSFTMAHRIATMHAWMARQNRPARVRGWQTELAL